MFGMFCGGFFLVLYLSDRIGIAGPFFSSLLKMSADRGLAGSLAIEALLYFLRRSTLGLRCTCMSTFLLERDSLSPFDAVISSASV